MGLSYDQSAPIFCAGYTVISGLRLVDQYFDRRILSTGFANTSNAITKEVLGLIQTGTYSQTATGCVERLAQPKYRLLR